MLHLVGIPGKRQSRGQGLSIFCHTIRIGLRAALAGALATLALGLPPTPAAASPWAEVGDAQLRSDIQLLAAAGVVDGITTHWPIPWAGLMRALRDETAMAGQPPNVRAAAGRVLAKAGEQLSGHRLHASATADAASTPNVVRGFDGMGREKAQAQISVEMIFDTTAIRISAGEQYSDRGGGQGLFMPDGSYIAQKIGGAVVYAGYLTHWWGPGWISALSLSNNARPFPQIGIERLGTSAFETPWLSWIGPWQMEFMVGLLDGPRIADNTLFNGLRVTFNPLPGLEIGLARTQEFCGRGHPCKPLATYFEFRNDSNRANRTNDEGAIDIHYSGMAWGTAFELYTQAMNEDSNPITHSGTSHLFGASVWLPIAGTAARITAEYTDSIATRNIFSFGNVLHGVAYNNSGYPDGLRYRGRTIGFSLDSDSRLASLQTSWIDKRNWTYTFSFHRAWISTPENPGNGVGRGNVVTAAPVTVNLGEARITMPLHWATIDIAGRLQDDQPRPSHGFKAAIEASLTFNL